MTAATTVRPDTQRSPADVLRLVVSGASLLLLAIVERLFGDTLVTFASELLGGLSAIPEWIADIIVAGTRLLGVVLVGGGLVRAVVQRQWRALVTVAVAGASAAVLAALLAGLGPEEGPAVVHIDDFAGPLSDRTFPTLAGIGVVTAMLTAAAPWMTRRSRRWGWAFIVGVIVTRVVVSPMSFGSLNAALIGWLVGAAALVALGAPSRKPVKESVVAGLASVGLRLQELEPASVDARGSTPYFGRTVDGTSVFVKALGVDERSADLLFRCYRLLQPRDLGDEKAFSSFRRAVEHEALVALAARGAGLRTPRLLAFAAAAPNAYVLAYAGIEGRSLDRVDPDEVSDDVLAAVWGLVAQLRTHRIAHRDLRLANIFLDDDGNVWLIDFGFGELAASDLLLATDVAELAASSSLYVGAARAADHAARSTDPVTLQRAVERLHPWALSGATRHAQKQRPGLLDELRDRLRQSAATAPAA